MLGRRVLLCAGIWYLVCVLSLSGTSAEQMKTDNPAAGGEQSHIYPKSSQQYFRDGLKKGPTSGQIVTEEGQILNFYYSDAVLKEGCFSCYSTVQGQIAHTPESLTAGGYLSQHVEGTVQYVEIDTLVVVYRHYYRDGSVRMDLSMADIQILKEEVVKSKKFIWRSSNLKCLMNTQADWLIIDRTLTPAQLQDVDGSGNYWLEYWSKDGATSVKQDMYDAGVVDGQYSVVIVFYAFENSEGAKAAYGGAAYGVNVDYQGGFLGNTAYIAIPLAWGLEQESTITHEYLHALDSIYEASGNPSGNDMWHADNVESFPYLADSFVHRSFIICNVLDPESWLRLNRRWARLSTVQDHDGDGVPDNGDLPITEETLGSLPTDEDSDDDGLSDLDEMTATYHSESNPLLPDSDGDGLLDGQDTFPLYSYNDQIAPGEPQVNGSIEEAEYIEMASTYARGQSDIAATIYTAWSEGILYLAADVIDDNVETPYEDPFWDFDDNLEINIDSRQNGWTHGDGRDYRFYVVPKGSRGEPHVSGDYFSPDSNEWRELDVSAITAKYAIRSGGYTIEMAIPADAMNAENTRLPDVNVGAGSSLRLTFWVRDYDAYGDWPKLNIFSRLGEEVPGFVKVYIASYVTRRVPQQYGSIQRAIESARNGDKVIVGRGTYVENIDFRGKTLTVTSADPNDSIVMAATVINSRSREPAVTFSGGQDGTCVLSGFTITGRDTGISCSSASPLITKCAITGNHGAGIKLTEGSNPTISNSTITDNKGAGIETWPYKSGSLTIFNYPTIINCTIIGNLRYGISGGIPTITNSIIYYNGSQVNGVQIENDITTATYSNIQGGWPGEGNINTDPLLADKYNGDYHLKSEIGRYDPTTRAWGADDITSPCIDAGNPTSPIGLEPSPNGGIVNMGAFGGTTEASMSSSNVGEGFETGDFSAFYWISYGDESWTISSNNRNSGSYAAQAGSINDGEATTLQVTLDCIPGEITFYYKISSESSWDFLRFYINGTQQDEWSGEKDWAQASFPVAEGRRTFRWTYSKDESSSVGDDTAWIDDIEFPVN